MDIFFNIDWQRLKNLVNDLENIAYNTDSFNGKAKLELTNLIYQVESDLTSIKTKLNLPKLNPYITSNSVLNSFKRVDEYKDLFEQENITFNNYFRQNDYQYWLSIFLLMKYNEIIEKRLSLFEIIDLFLERIKDKSLNLEDIELTDSGATRCKTTLRFTIYDLKNIGLLNIYDAEHNKSWTLSFFGFFVAASFCLDPIDNERKPLSSKITRFNQSTWYFKINKHIWERINQLTTHNYWAQLIGRITRDNLTLENLKSGPEIFKEYLDKIKEMENTTLSDKRKFKELGSFLEELNEKYNLDSYMKDLSSKYDAEAWFEEIKRELG